MTGDERLDDLGQKRMLLGLRAGDPYDQVLNRHTTGTSNGPNEGLNLAIEKGKRAGHDFRRFDHHRLRCILHAGGIT